MYTSIILCWCFGGKKNVKNKKLKAKIYLLYKERRKANFFASDDALAVFRAKMLNENVINLNKAQGLCERSVRTNKKLEE